MPKAMHGYGSNRTDFETPKSVPRLVVHDAIRRLDDEHVDANVGDLRLRQVPIFLSAVVPGVEHADASRHFLESKR